MMTGGSTPKSRSMRVSNDACSARFALPVVMRHSDTQRLRYCQSSSWISGCVRSFSNTAVSGCKSRVTRLYVSLETPRASARGRNERSHCSNDGRSPRACAPAAQTSTTAPAIVRRTSRRARAAVFTRRRGGSGSLPARRSTQIALASCRLAEAPRRNARRTMERAHEVREVAEADVVRDVGDRALVFRQEARRAAHARADEILMRRHAEHGGEEAEEVEAGEAGLARRPLEIDLLVRVRLDPEGGVDGATAIARRCRRPRVPAPGDDVDEAGGERHSGLFGTEIGRTVRGRLRELAEHHQLRHRRQSARAPHLRAADRVDEFRRQSQRQAFVALRVLVRAHELVARMADEDRSRDELERHPANAISEAALADVREREAVMTLRSEEHTSELQSLAYLVCRLLL